MNRDERPSPRPSSAHSAARSNDHTPRAACPPAALRPLACGESPHGSRLRGARWRPHRSWRARTLEHGRARQYITPAAALPRALNAASEEDLEASTMQISRLFVALSLVGFGVASGC